MSRPDWVLCIAEERQDRIGESLCGRTIGWAREQRSSDPILLQIDPNKMVKVLKEAEPVFISLAHWYLNATQGGRYQGCEDCLVEVQKAIKLEGRLK